MGLRETMNKNPQLTTGVTIGITVLAIALIVWQLMPSRTSVEAPTKAYYTIDDGKTFFVDAAVPERLPPFTYQGKEAVRAHVYRYGENGQLFVVYMEQLTKPAKETLEKFYKDPANKGKVHPDLYDDRSWQVKKPGKPWIGRTFQTLDAVSAAPEKNGEFAIETLPE